MTSLQYFTLALMAPMLLASSCGPTDPDPDGGTCELGVSVGTGSGSDFVPLEDGSPSELILGFQGVRMLRFALSVEGRTPTNAEVSAFVTVESELLELSQRTRERVFIETPDGFILDSWFVFFNDTPAASLIGREAEIEVIVRADGCVGGTQVRVTIRDDDACVDHSITVDAGMSDAGPLDAAACEGGL